MLTSSFTPRSKSGSRGFKEVHPALSHSVTPSSLLNLDLPRVTYHLLSTLNQQTVFWLPGDYLFEMDPFMPVASNEPEFICFAKLPLELRLKAWRLSFPSSRWLEIHERYSPWPISGRQTGAILSAKNHNLPTTLRVNQESRKETQKHYRLLFHKNRQEIVLPKLDY